MTCTDRQADINQPYPSKHDNTKHFSSSAQLRYHSVAFILQQHFATRIDPCCSLHTAKNQIICWIGTAKTTVPEKNKKCGNTGLPCLDKPMSGQGGGWGRVLQHDNTQATSFPWSRQCKEALVACVHVEVLQNIWGITLWTFEPLFSNPPPQRSKPHLPRRP